MNLLSTFDLYLWDLFVPKLNEQHFKSRTLCLIALTYISVYKLPRKFLMHYFRGSGKEVVIDSNKLIMNNNVVLERLSEAIATYNNNGSPEGSFNICQTDINDPNYKYSIGSFTIHYSMRNASIEITINSVYHFQDNPNRLTKHLHNRLYSTTTKGYSKRFNINSLPFVITFSELADAKYTKPKRIPKYAVLV